MLMRRWKLVSIVTVFVIFLMLFLFNRSPGANLSLLVSPSVSKILIDSRASVRAGNIYLSPGIHKITASMAGFTNQSMNIVVAKNKLTTKTIILIPSSDEGYSWLANHPAEDLLRQQIASNSIADQAQKAVEAAPLIKELPYIGAGFEFRIDYGQSETGSSIPEIIITAPDVPSQQDAIAWMKARGYDPVNYTIRYVTAQP